MDDQHCDGRFKVRTSDTEGLIISSDSGSLGGYEDEDGRKGNCLRALRVSKTSMKKSKGLEEHVIASRSPVKKGIQKKRRAVQEKPKFLKERWSSERYGKAQKSMLEILEAEGAVFGKPISRRDLRKAARNHIGDTGLLDHLLKHINGEIAPGGTKRFRRWHNSDGVMEYWLESADLDNLRREVGATDPYWTPPPGWKPSEGPDDGSQVGPEEYITIPKAYLDKMKSEFMQDMSRKAKEEIENLVKELREELYKEIREELLKQMQQMHEGLMKQVRQMGKELLKQVHEDLLNQDVRIEKRWLAGENHFQAMYDTWLAKVDQLLMERGLSGIPAKDSAVLDPTYKAFADVNQDKAQGDSALIWVDNSGLINFGQGNLAERVANIERVVHDIRAAHEFASKKSQDQPNGTPDSVGTTNSKLDFENLSSQTYHNDSSFGQEAYNSLQLWKPNAGEAFSLSGNYPSINPQYF